MAKYIVDYYETYSKSYEVVGCYAIFEREDGVIICDDYKLREIRNSNPLESNIYCFDDETFLKVA